MDATPLRFFNPTWPTSFCGGSKRDAYSVPEFSVPGTMAGYVLAKRLARRNDMRGKAGVFRPGRISARRFGRLLRRAAKKPERRLLQCVICLRSSVHHWRSFCAASRFRPSSAYRCASATSLRPCGPCLLCPATNLTCEIGFPYEERRQELQGPNQGGRQKLAEPKRQDDADNRRELGLLIREQQEAHVIEARVTQTSKPRSLSTSGGMLPKPMPTQAPGPNNMSPWSHYLSPSSH